MNSHHIGVSERPALKVVRPGLFTTVQDAGRPGFMKYGVPISGAMDLRSMQAANLLVGNLADAAVLEFTLVGPELEILQNCCIGMSGAPVDVYVDHQISSRSSWNLTPGQRIRFGRLKSGCRAYVSIAGGIDVPVVLGSRSTYVPGAFGGFGGRAILKGDVLARGDADASRPSATSLTDESIIIESEPTIRVLEGAEYDQFSPLSRQQFLQTLWTASAESNRMGIRLAGPALMPDSTGMMDTTGLMPGSIQVPPDGQPIVIMRDGQTTGGYPRLFHVVDRDIDILAQVRGGKFMRFKLC